MSDSKQSDSSPAPETASGLWNPYLAGVLLGATLLASFLVLGAGLGASAGLARIGAYLLGVLWPSHLAASEYFGRWGANPLNYYLVFMLAGAFVGGLFSALLARRVSVTVEGQKLLVDLVGVQVKPLRQAQHTEVIDLRPVRVQGMAEIAHQRLAHGFAALGALGGDGRAGWFAHR